jgi:virulence factor
MSADRVRIGIVGAGGIARGVHLPSLSEMPDVELVAISDLVAERSAALAERFGIARTYLSYHEMLARESLDAVFVLVEPGNLFHVTWHALDSGRHVFMEKPPGITAVQARSLGRKAVEAGRHLQVGFNRRHIPAVRWALEAVRARTRITQVEGTFFKFGDAMYDRGALSAFVSDSIHAVDLVRWIAAGTPVSAALVAARNDGEPEDNAWNGVVRFDNGVTGIVKANYRTGGRVHRLEIHGSGASAFVDLGMGAGLDCAATLLTHEGAASYSAAAAGPAEERVQRLDGDGPAAGTPFHRGYGFYQEDRHFVDCVRGAAAPDPGIEDAARSIELVEMLLANRI